MACQKVNVARFMSGQVFSGRCVASPAQGGVRPRHRALHLVEKATTFPAYGATMTNVALDRDTAPAPVFQGCRLLGKAKDTTFKKEQHSIIQQILQVYSYEPLLKHSSVSISVATISISYFVHSCLEQSIFN